MHNCLLFYLFYSILLQSKMTTTDIIIRSIQHNRAILNNNNNVNENIEYPCGLCSYQVKHNDKAIFCTSCELWIHIRCNGITVDEYRELQQRNRDNPDLIVNESWSCFNCVMNKRSEFFPFTYLSTTELDNLNLRPPLL